MLVMHESVSLEYALEGRSMRTQEVPSVHQLPVYLVLDKGHQNARENEPATDLQDKHHFPLGLTLPSSDGTLDPPFAATPQRVLTIVLAASAVLIPRPH